MELQQFIQETLVQIARGVEGANARLAESEAAVNPRNVARLLKSEYGAHGWVHGDAEKGKPDKYLRLLQLIDFDVAVVATEGKQTKGGVEITVGVFGLGGGGKSDTSQRSESRIKFSIPMVLPNSPDD